MPRTVLVWIVAEGLSQIFTAAENVAFSTSNVRSPNVKDKKLRRSSNLGQHLKWIQGDVELDFDPAVTRRSWVNDWSSDLLTEHRSGCVHERPALIIDLPVRLWQALAARVTNAASPLLELWSRK